MAWLVDVNVLVALMHARHVHCPRAVRWLGERTERGSLILCRAAQTGALRVLTQSAWMKDDVLTATEFWAGWDRLVADDRFAFAKEPETLEQRWREITARLPRDECAGTDAYFAALALAGGWTLTSFDNGLRRFAGVRLELLV